MGELERKDFEIKIGDYVYYTNNTGKHRVVKVMDIKSYQIKDDATSDETEYLYVSGYWSEELMLQLPNTLQEFDAIKKFKEVRICRNINAIFRGLQFDKKVISSNNLCGFSEKLLNLDNYKSSTIIALNEILADGYDVEDFLKILIPDITNMTEM